MEENSRTKQSNEPADRSDTRSESSPIHVPVLLQSVVACIRPLPGDIVFDGTYGAGGYSNELSTLVGADGLVIATDQDPVVIARGSERSNVRLHHANFSNIDTILAQEKVSQINHAVLDLGISSDQLDSESRGISFRHRNAPLDMRMDNSSENAFTAWGIINVWEENEIADVLYYNADEIKSRRIAKAIIEQRKKNPIDTVGDLVEVVHRTIGSGGRTDSATRTFQALRIEVNKEIDHLKTFLNKVYPLLKPCGKDRTGGTIAIVSFHSIEDRIVKNTFKDWKQANKGIVMTKKPIRPDASELLLNKRARSATLRVFQKTSLTL